jgi:DNA-binding winged helix-turn-helix (wHTH) protein
MLYVFDECTLDTETHELIRHGRICRLRRKVYETLSYLLAQDGRVVSRQELCEQLWPQQFISEATLESTIKAVRQAIGDSGRDQRLIETLYGQGYRFIATVKRRDSARPARPGRESDTVTRPDTSGAEGQRKENLVVGRKAELAQLTRCFSRALEGARQLVFVAGEPGIGKTTLVDAFLSGLVEDESIWIGRGQCVEQFGAGEAYRPLLEALGRLAQGARGQQVRAVLTKHAPMWLAQLPGLIDAVEFEVLQRRCAGATRDRMLRELVEAGTLDRAAAAGARARRSAVE